MKKVKLYPVVEVKSRLLGTRNGLVLHTERSVQGGKGVEIGRTSFSLRTVRRTPTQMNRIVSRRDQVMIRHGATPCLRGLAQSTRIPARAAMIPKITKTLQIWVSINTQFRRRSTSPRSSLPSWRELWTTFWYTDSNQRHRFTSRNGKASTSSQWAVVELSNRPKAYSSAKEWR